MWLSSRVHRKWTCFDTWLKNNQVLSKVERRVHLVFVQAQWARKVQAVPWHMWNIGKRTCTGVALNLKIWQQQSIISLTLSPYQTFNILLRTQPSRTKTSATLDSQFYANVVAYRHSPLSVSRLHGFLVSPNGRCLIHIGEIISTLSSKEWQWHSDIEQMLTSWQRRGNKRVLFIYLPYEEEGDEERRHSGHQSENQVLQLREPLHMAQEGLR